MPDFPATGHGVATIATPKDEEKDLLGFTAPDLHRRVYDDTPTDPSEALPRKYTFGILDGVNSYRMEERFYHDEESTTCEIP